MQTRVLRLANMRDKRDWTDGETDSVSLKLDLFSLKTKEYTSALRIKFIFHINPVIQRHLSHPCYSKQKGEKCKTSENGFRFKKYF